VLRDPTERGRVLRKPYVDSLQPKMSLLNCGSTKQGCPHLSWVVAGGALLPENWWSKFSLFFLWNGKRGLPSPFFFSPIPFQTSQSHFCSNNFLD